MLIQKICLILVFILFELNPVLTYPDNIDNLVKSLFGIKIFHLPSLAPFNKDADHVILMVIRLIFYTIYCRRIY